ncbi:hypothetical protein AJ87_11170 [Rhizobium yanglingense]|nr:hypothetical protein AJ87_11170 [Rhizobium yanglingense]
MKRWSLASQALYRTCLVGGTVVDDQVLLQCHVVIDPPQKATELCKLMPGLARPVTSVVVVSSKVIGAVVPWCLQLWGIIAATLLASLLQ